MATILNNQDLEDNKKQPGPATGGGQGAVISNAPAGGASGGPAPAPAANPAVPGQQQPGSSGRFQNLGKFIKANNPGQFGQQFQNKVGQVAQQGQQAIGQAKQQFQTDAEKTGQAIAQTGQAAQQGATNLSQAAGQPEFDNAATALQNGVNAQNNGPQGLNNADQLGLQAQQAGSIANAVGSEGGRFGLLQKFFNRPTYTQGQGRLDNLLLGSQQGAIANVRQQGRQVGNQLNQATGEAAAQVGALNQQAADVRNAATAAGTAAQTGIQTGLKTDAQKYLEDFKNASNPENALKEFQQQGSQLAGLDLSPEQKAALFQRAGGGYQGTSQELQDAVKSGDYSSLLGRTSAEAQQGAGRFNKLSDILKSGSKINGDVLNRGQVGLSDEAKTQLEGQTGAAATDIFGQNYQKNVDDNLTHFYHTKTNELAKQRAAQYATDENPYANLKGGAFNMTGNSPEKAQYDKDINAIASKYGNSAFGNPDYAKEVAAYNKNYNQDRLAKELSAEGGWAAKQTGGYAADYGNKLRDTSSTEGKAFYDEQQKAAKMAAIKNILGV